MASKWQQWMPFHIDRFRGSPAVQAMHPAARIGFLYLLATGWQTEDCTVPNDPLQLAEMSGLGDELWALHGPRILRKFEYVDGDSKLRNTICFEEWEEAKRIFEARQGGAKRTNSARSPESMRMRSPDGHRVAMPAGASRSADTRTGTVTSTEEQKPSRRKRPSDDGMKHSKDPRHMACKDHIFAAYRHKNGGAAPDWDGREGAALGMLLNANPELNPETIKPLLAHWARSEINHSDRPSIWIPKLSSFRIAPIDRFNKPIEENANVGPRTSSPSPAKQRVDDNRRAIAEALAKRGVPGPWDHAQPNSQTVPTSGRVGVDGGISEGPRTVGGEVLPPQR